MASKGEVNYGYRVVEKFITVQKFQCKHFQGALFGCNILKRPIASTILQLKADRLHPCTPTDYRHTYKHIRLVITLLFWLLHLAKQSPYIQISRL